MCPDTGDSARARESEIDSFKRQLYSHLKHTVGKTYEVADHRDWYHALAHTVRDLLVEAWMDSTRQRYHEDAKRVYYLSMEFLIGRSLEKNLLNTGFYRVCRDTLNDLGLDFAAIRDQEAEAALGNGGLGRLAACLMESMATVGVAGYGYGIRYDYGMFHQRIEDGRQVEVPENWLRYGNPWEFARPEVCYAVNFGGHVTTYRDDQGRERHHWAPGEGVRAVAYDQPMAGYAAWTVNTIRLWAANAAQAFDLGHFNRGDYIASVQDQVETESLSRVLYPDDSTHMGRTLRFKQEYFFASATLQDILRRFRNQHTDMAELPDQVAIQLNDTHPAVAVPELMRLLLDHEGLDWAAAWDITRRTFSYTNHTLQPEALETWPVYLFESLLPRHLQIIYDINHAFLEDVRHAHPGDGDLLARVSLIAEGEEPRVRMANLAFIGSHAVNGVAALHTRLMRSTVFADMNALFPERITNKTNGITPRRWLNVANRPLAELADARIGPDWVTDLNQLHGLLPHADDAGFRDAFRRAKHRNKLRLATVAHETAGTVLPHDFLVDAHVKRIHEYKRQLMNILGVIARYNRIRDGAVADVVPRTVVFAGKAAPGYWLAKHIIKLINDVADVVNNDPKARDALRVVFLPNYNVSLAERIIPAAELSQQISTAGTEASGTGNMKLALNGALTLGTHDGANVEIAEQVDETDIFLFGLTAEEVAERRAAGHDPHAAVEATPELARALDMVGQGFFSPGEPDRFRPILDTLFQHGDWYLVTADFAAYMAAQDRVDALYRDREAWTAAAIRNVARMGRFSSDLTVADYAHEIWDVPTNPVPAAVLGA